MSVITINGMTSSGALEIGALVARDLGCDYVDRLILAEAARKIGISVAAVAERTEQPPTLGDRIGAFLGSALEQSAMAGDGDPYFATGADILLSEYREISEQSTAEHEQISDARLLEVTCSVMMELAQRDDVVIIGRGSNILLTGRPGALHVGLHASLECRIDRLMERQQLDRPEAEKLIHETDRGQTNYYQRFFHCKPYELSSFHLLLNTEWLDNKRASAMIVQAVQGMSHG